MRRMVKICGLTDAAQVAAAVAAGADALGFVFAESVREVTPGEARAAAAAVPSRVLRVAVMRHPSRARWAEVARVFRPDVLQTDEADFAELEVAPEVQRWPVVREGDYGEHRTLPPCFVYEGVASGRGQTVDWSRAAKAARRGRMILAGGLRSDNVAAAIAAVDPWGLDVSSGVESAPGVKDPARMAEFVQAVRRAESAAAGGRK